MANYMLFLMPTFDYTTPIPKSSSRRLSKKCFQIRGVLFVASKVGSEWACIAGLGELGSGMPSSKLL